MQRQSQAVSANDHRSQERKCCGLVDDVKYHVKSERETRTKPQPWIVLKSMVFVTIAIVAYSAYVYIGRLCVPYIKGRYNRRAVGIVLLIIFVILYFWMLWSYLRVVFTSPGYAKDHVPPTPQPLGLLQSQPIQPPPPTLKVYDDAPFQEPMTERRFSHKTEPSLTTSVGTRCSITDSVGGPSYEDILLRTGMDRGSHTQAQPEPRESLPMPAAVSASPAQRKLRKFFRPTGLRYSTPKVYIARRPPSTAVLLPENRYCGRDGIVKPYRAHHCRHCGTCVLKYDHHCPWIGRCVGARNHKFFVNFTEAACIFCVYVFATLLGFTVHDIVHNRANVDPQLIIIIALAGIFGLFTSTLTFSHVWLILKSQTTIESMVIRRMKERESAQLDNAFSYFDFRSKNHTRKEWDREWGNLETEGHIWWMSDKRAAWEDVMGESVWGWFFPVSRGSNNGLTYRINPRFDDDGRWRRRSEWPPELQ